MDWFKRIFQGASEILTDKQTFVNTANGAVQVPNADDNTRIGKARSLVQSLPGMAREMVLPSRGYSEEEITTAKPTLREKAMGVARMPADIVSGFGSLSNLSPISRAVYAPIINTSIGQRLADAGDAITRFGVPKTAGEAQVMRLTDIGTMGVGSVSRVGKLSKLEELIAGGYVRRGVTNTGKELLEVQAPGGRWMPVDSDAAAIHLASSNLKPSPKLDGVTMPPKVQQPPAGAPPIPPARSVQPTPVAREEVASLEEAALQARERVPEPYREAVVPLEKIVTQSTPLSRKVNMYDLWGRTPDRVMEKIGFGKEAKLLRNQYEKYAMELPQNIDKITEWSKRAPAPDASKRIFLHLDGHYAHLSPEEKQVADEIKVYMNEWADRLKIPQGNRIANYITHIFDDQLIEKEFDEDLAKIIADRVPGEVYDPFLEKRLGALGYKQDVWAALDAYTKRATRKVHLDPALDRINEKAGSTLDTSNIEESQFRFVKEYIDRVNMRPTETDKYLDTTVKQVAGYRFGQRPVANLSRTLRRLSSRAAFGLNPGSALRNLSQGVNTYATLGEKFTILGYSKLFSPAARRELEAQGIFSNTFIQDRSYSATKKVMEKADKALFFFFDQAEKMNRGAAYLGAKAKGLGNGMNEEQAVEYAKNIVRKTQFSFDSVDTPVRMSSDLVKSLLQWQTYTVKQTEFLVELAKDRNFAGLLRYGLAGFVFVNTIGKAFGMEEKELLPLFRFDTPPSLRLPWEAVKAVADAPDKYGNDRTLTEKAKDVGKAALGLIPASSQVKKTYQGMQAVEEGGSFDAAGRQQFEQGESPAAKVQTLLFGKYASQNAKDYFDKGDAPTGDKELDRALKEQTEGRHDGKVEEIKLNRELSSLPPEEANARLKQIYDEDPALYKRIVAAKKEEDKLGKLSDGEKGMLKLGVENGARARFVVGKLRTMATPEEKNAYLKDLYDKKVITKDVLKQIKDLDAQ